MKQELFEEAWRRRLAENRKLGETSGLPSALAPFWQLVGRRAPWVMVVLGGVTVWVWGWVGSESMVWVSRWVLGYE